MAAIDNVQHLFNPDREQMASHLAHLFGGDLYGCHDGLVEIAWTDAFPGPDGRHRLSNAQLFPLDDLDEIIEFAININRTQGHNTYVGAALRRPDTPFGKRAKDEHFYALTACYADLDDPGVADRVKGLYAHCPPTMAVVTGRNPHTRAQLWWRQEEPIRDPAEARRQNLALAMALGGDGVVVNPSRVMRLAGTIAWATKPGRTIENTHLVPVKGAPRLYMPGQVGKAFPPATEAQVVSAAAGSDALQPSTPAAPGQIAKLSPSRLITEIRSGGGQWHAKTLTLVAHWVNRGWSDAEIHAAAYSLTLPGWTAEQTRYEVGQMIAGARLKWGIAEPQDVVEEPPEAPPLKATPLGTIDPAKLPRREWVLGHRLIRKFVTLTVAPGGAGKSTLTMEEMVAVATGQAITGQPVHVSGKVWIYNNEDPRDELERRIAAICLQFDIPLAAIADRVFLDSGRDRRLLVAKELNGAVVLTPDVDALETEIRERGIVAMTIDPFVRVHQVDENDNAAIDAVADVFGRIADRTGCAFDLVHHTRKLPSGVEAVEGNADSSRGAGALVAAARIAHTVATMSKKDAEELGIQDDERRWYVRVDDAKGNMTAPAENAEWFRRVGVALPNGPFGGDGDEVGVLVPWEAPDIRTPITSAVATAILKDIDARWRDGTPFAKQGDRSVVAFMVHAHGLRQAQAKKLLKDWITSQMVVSEVVDRKTKTTGLRVMKWPG